MTRTRTKSIRHDGATPPPSHSPPFVGDVGTQNLVVEEDASVLQVTAGTARRGIVATAAREPRRPGAGFGQSEILLPDPILGEVVIAE